MDTKPTKKIHKRTPEGIQKIKERQAERWRLVKEDPIKHAEHKKYMKDRREAFTPEQKEASRIAYRTWVRNNREKSNTYQREYARRRRLRDKLSKEVQNDSVDTNVETVENTITVDI